MQVIIIEWRIIKQLKTLCFCTSSLEINQRNVHCFTPVKGLIEYEMQSYQYKNSHCVEMILWLQGFPLL